MVKISFQPAVAGIKGDKADKASASASASAAARAPAAEILLTPARESSASSQLCFSSFRVFVLRSLILTVRNGIEERMAQPGQAKQRVVQGSTLCLLARRVPALPSHTTGMRFH